MSESREIVQNAWAAFSAGDIDGLLEHLSDDVRWELVGGEAFMPHSPVYDGKQDLVDRLLSMAWQLYDRETFTLTPTHFFVDEPHVVMEFTVTSQLVNGSEYNDVRYIAVIRVENAKIVEIREYPNTLLAATVLLA